MKDKYYFDVPNRGKLIPYPDGTKWHFFPVADKKFANLSESVIRGLCLRFIADRSPKFFEIGSKAIKEDLEIILLVLKKELKVIQNLSKELNLHGSITEILNINDQKVRDELIEQLLFQLKFGKKIIELFSHNKDKIFDFNILQIVDFHAKESNLIKKDYFSSLQSEMKKVISELESNLNTHEIKVAIKLIERALQIIPKEFSNKPQLGHAV